MRADLAALYAWLVCCAAALSTHKYSTRVIRTKYGPLRGIVVHSHPQVEAYLGVPYATPPLGSLRYMPPVTPSQWRTTRLADALGAACPQVPPAAVPREEALLLHPRARIRQLERLLPMLVNQSEDCLYVNLYVPVNGLEGESEGAGLPCLVFVHGESYEWSSGNAYDGTTLAAHGNIIVVTINFRLGVLGFLKTGAKGSAQGNFGLMDLVAGLHWLRENLPAFGGNPEKVTLMGHGTGAALANFLAVSPVARELLKRVVLLSGSGLSSWALQREPLTIKRKVAEQTGCHGDLLEDDLAPCLRNKPLAELLAIRLDPPRFLPGFAPFVDGTVIVNPSSAPPPSDNSRLGAGAAAVASAAGHELADFPHRELLFGLTTTESYLEFNAQDLEFGFNETRRDRILRTFVRNAYYYHLNEIYSTLKNEYTDWDKPVQNPLSVRDATLEVLSDGRTAAPLIRLGYLHALRGGVTYFTHFHHLSQDKDYPQRPGSVHGEELPYYLGMPLSLSHHQQNFTQLEQRLSKLCMHYLANFVKYGNPNDPSATPPPSPVMGEAVPIGPDQTPYWDTYDTINQLYMEISGKSEMRSHYRGHKMSLWLSLIPQLHRPGSDLPDAAMRHHHFQDDNANYYEGAVRTQSLSRAHVPHVVSIDVGSRGGELGRSTPPPRSAQPKPSPAPPALSTECPPNSTTTPIQPDDALLRRLASSHYQSYTAALTVTIAVGCFLLLLNVLIFAGIYHQRGSRPRRCKDDLAEAGSSSSSDNYDGKLDYEVRAFDGKGFGFECKSAHVPRSSGSKFDLRTLSDCGEPTFGEYSCYDEKHRAARSSLPDVSVGSAIEAGSVVCIDTQKPDIQRVDGRNSDAIGRTSTFEPRVVDSSTQVKFGPITDSSDATSDTNGDSESIAAGGSGILRVPPAATTPAPPGIMKKRVQIQEISV
ncbi:neuroligin-1-like [Vanessa cardui]|uniref:neuroligin-1-like n=1 Tax=Vanessa cardui TaxID=171605 RepID=UPI001F140F28|nr:neuroligin-1-like [Vanessa cardui]